MVFRRAFLDCFYIASLAGFGVLAGVPHGKRSRRAFCSLSTATMEAIAQDACFQTLTSLETQIHCLNTKDLVEMFRAHQTHTRESNTMHTGIQSAMIEVSDISKKDIPKLCRDIMVIQKQLGVADAKITLQHWCTDLWWLRY